MKFEVLLPRARMCVCVCVCARVCVCVFVCFCATQSDFLPSFTVFVHKCHFLILVGAFIVQNGKTLFLLRNGKQIAVQVIKLKTCKQKKNSLL